MSPGQPQFTGKDGLTSRLPWPRWWRDSAISYPASFQEAAEKRLLALARAA